MLSGSLLVGNTNKGGMYVGGERYQGRCVLVKNTNKGGIYVGEEHQQRW